MYDSLKVLVANLAMPLPICLGLMILGLFLLRWRRRWGAGMLGLGIALMLLASSPPVANGLLTPLETRYPALPALPNGEPLAAVVVLGGGWQPEAPRSNIGRLRESSAIRLMEGVRLWRQRPELPLVVTGANRDSDILPVARGYADAAVGMGVPEAQLQVLDWPTDTGLEARAVRDSFGQGARIVLVTSASHMPRAMRHFHRVGLAPIAAPTHYLTEHQRNGQFGDWVPAAEHLRKTERAVYEAMGLLMVGAEH